MAQAPPRRSHRARKPRVQFTPSLSSEVERQLEELLTPSTSRQPDESSQTSRTRQTPQTESVQDHTSLLQAERDKLKLELELLTLKNQIASQQLEHELGTPPKRGQVKKKANWPQDYVPGASSTEFEKLEVTDFTAGYLVMIKPYSPELKEVMLQLLELLMVKATSYTWRSVRGFYQHIARQVELCRLEFEDYTSIRELATTFFKHSDLRGHQTPYNNNREQKPSMSTSSTLSDDNKSKSCRQWNYTGACSCDSTANAYAGHHRCRGCAKTHPMLHCPKRRSPIPDVNFTSNPQN